MASREAVCKECTARFPSGARGKLPVYCSDCRYARQLVASAKWKARNPDQLKAYRVKHHAENRDAENARSRAWKAANPERVAAWRRMAYVERQMATNTEYHRDYGRRNPGKLAEIQNRRRARLLAAFVAPVDPVAIRDRDGGLCGICGSPVALADQSMDHIIPLARGGTHEPANVQLAHRRCNSSKGARVPTALT